MASDRDNDRYDRYVAQGAEREKIAQMPVETLARQIRELDEEWDIPISEREDPYSVAQSILRVEPECMADAEGPRMTQCDLCPYEVEPGPLCHDCDLEPKCPEADRWYGERFEEAREQLELLQLLAPRFPDGSYDYSGVRRGG